MQILINDAERENNFEETQLLLFAFSIAMIAYVSYFSVLKFKRINKEKNEFEKIRNLTEHEAL